MGLVAPQHVESSRIRNWTHVPCIGGLILIHCTTMEVLFVSLSKSRTFSLLLLPHYWQEGFLDGGKAQVVVEGGGDMWKPTGHITGFVYWVLYSLQNILRYVGPSLAQSPCEEDLKLQDSVFYYIFITTSQRRKRRPRTQVYCPISPG